MLSMIIDRLRPMSRESEIMIQFFQPADQRAARELILSGLQEHWGELNGQLNPDLDDISTNYAGSVFLVAKLGKRIIGTGALIPRSKTMAEIVRMSVASDMRRQRVGTRILQRLVEEANQLGFKRIILETTASWKEVVAFYEGFGFRRIHDCSGSYGVDAYFALDI